MTNKRAPKPAKPIKSIPADANARRRQVITNLPDGHQVRLPAGLLTAFFGEPLRQRFATKPGTGSGG